jgi:ABC-2 type transport system ATP-binding protein
MIEHPSLEIMNSNSDSISTSAIKAISISRVFQVKTAVDNLSLDIKEGEIYAFLGPNGAGKSTTVKILVTLLNATSGTATIFGKDINKDAAEVRLLIGVALQEASLDESQTGIEFLRLQGRLYGLTKEQINKRIESLLPLIDIGDAINKQIKTYSGGMKRRLDLAAAIIHSPKVLFLDEPTTGLDPISRAKVWHEINRLNKEIGMTIFLTTQYLEEADQLADRVGIIREGALAIEGTPRELKDSLGDDMIIALVSTISDSTLQKLNELKGISKAQLAKSPDPKFSELVISTPSGSSTIGPVAVMLNQEGVTIESLTLRTTTLDDVFLEVTGNRITTAETIN